MKNVKKIAAFIAALTLAVAGYANLDDITTVSGKSDRSIADTVATREMKVTFLDVGQGDCTIVQTEGHNMLIDAGNNDQGESVVAYLLKNGIDTLDYLILTHPDADHIGGADDVLENIDVQMVLMPDVANDTITYLEVIDDIKEFNIQIVYPDEELVDQSDLNSSSVGIKLNHGINSFVMCGDAEEKSEETMAKHFGSELECDVLKCGHHGSSTATSDEFLKATDPTWAVISCGVDNQYGHPHWETIEKLENDDVQIYRTDQMGTIIAISDGENINWVKGN